MLARLQEPIKTMLCNHDTEIEHAYDDLLNSSKQTLDSMLELQEVRLAACAFTF
jgi:protein AATF/BFR2